MSKRPSRGRSTNSSVFINCPFDDDYLPCFQALLFVITISGYQARCALEENDAGDIRFEKLKRLIGESDFTVHDLSRTELTAGKFPRFNMPFELGLMMGAKKFGPPKQARKRACIMTSVDYVLPHYLSDLAGNDTASHGDDPHAVIKIVRDHLHYDPDGKALPGATHMAQLFDTFRQELNQLARKAKLTASEVHARHGYRTFMDILRTWWSYVATAGSGD